MVIRSIQPADPLTAIAAIDSIRCGAEAARYFSLEEGYINLNHGSFGTFPRIVRDVMRYYQDRCEENPDRFIRYDYAKALDHSRRLIAGYLNAPIDTCVFVPNATTAINVVLRNLVYHPDDIILYFSSIYGACEMTIKYLEETTPVAGHSIKYTQPISDNALCALFEAAINSLRASGKNPKVAVFDTINSLPGVRVPYERLTALCREHGVLSCIDGAHGIGHIPLDLTALDPDFFVSNCHKWLYAPRGAALFYVPLRTQHLIRSTLPTSHGFQPRGNDDVVKSIFEPNGKSEFINNFEYVGTLDSSAYLCIPAALTWRSKLCYGDRTGEDAIHAYCDDLAREGGRQTAAVLGTEVMENDEGSLGRGIMLANVRLPVSYREHAGGDLQTAIEICQWLARTLLFEKRAYVAVYVHGEAFWARLSATVYLTQEDFVGVAHALADLCERARAGAWRQTTAAEEASMQHEELVQVFE